MVAGDMRGPPLVPPCAYDLDPHGRRRFGSLCAIELLRERDDWLLTKCRDDSGATAVVKSVRTASARAHRTLRGEASLLWQLLLPGHDGVVKILEQAEHDEPFWYAMAWASGSPLTATNAGTLLPVPKALRIGGALAAALEYVHSRGIVHGDVAPANTLVDETDCVTLIDFGTAALAFDAQAAREIGYSDQPRVGTPGYVAPERIQGGALDTQSDLYSLGCMLYELLTGKPPFHADDPAALARQHVELAPRAPSTLRPELPAELDMLMLKLLAKDPARRCAAASEVCEALAVYKSGSMPPVSAVRTRYVPFHRSRLVGRESALRSITAGVDRARSGNGGLHLVSGESGIGKTRLLNEAARYASERGFEVLVGRCHELVPTRGSNRSAGRPLGPFLPLLAWTADLKRAKRTSSDDELQRASLVLSAYEPSLASVDAAAAPTLLPSELARARVLKSLATVLHTIAATEPVLLIIDDVQWADDLSLGFLSSDLVQTLADARLCIVAAYRADELSSEQQKRLSARASGETHLERLTVDEVSLLSRSLLANQVVPAHVSEFLHGRSGGNPFLVIEYLHSLRQQGALRSALYDPSISELDVDTHDLQIPSGLNELFELRISQLSPSARRMLEFGAVLGTEFPSALLEACAHRMGLGLNATSAISELGAQRLFEALPNGRCRFVHDKLRDAQLSALTPSERRELHRQAAALLSSSDRFDASSAELGLHFAEAGLPERAAPYLRDAADQAARCYANADAVDLYGLALEQVRGSSSEAVEATANAPAPSVILELSEARGDVLLRSGRNREAALQYTATLTQVDPATRARLLRKQATALRTAHDYAGATSALERAEHELACVRGPEESNLVHEWIEIQQSRFWLYYFERRGGPITEAVVARMQPLVEQHGTPLQRSSFFECVASHVMARDRYLFSREAVAAAQRGVTELTTTTESAGQAAGPRFVLAFSLVLGGRDGCRAAIELFDAILTELEPIGDPMLISRALVYQAVAQRRLGQPNAVKTTNARARRYAERAQLTPYIGACLACDAWLAWQAGRLDEAEHLAHEATSWWRRGTHVFPFRWLADYIVLDLYHVRDDFANARVVIDDLLDPAQKLFEAPLATALAAAKDAFDTDDARETSRRLQTVLQLAHAEGYL